MIRRLTRERFDVVFYAPWASGLIERSGRAAPAGGAETQLFLVGSALAAHGVRVGMIVVGTPEELPATVRGIRILPQRPQRASARVVRSVGLALRALLSAMRPRTRVLVQRNAGPTTAVAALAARLRRARFVYSSANVVDFELERLDGRLNVRLFEWGVRRADEVVVQTDEQAALCRRRFGRDPVVIRSVAERAERRRLAPEAFLWIGRLVPYKRLDVLLELARALPEARFWVVTGDARDARPDVIELLERADAELDNVEVMPPCARHELAQLVERAVAIVNTSDYEGMPNVFLEGWARGVPALAFSHDPDGVVAEHGLGAFAGGDPVRLLDAARRMWEERTNQEAVAERCTGYVRSHHDQDVVARGWLEVIGRG
jgi:glycosyltransferase involved in cell wall biosynthesis